MSISKTTYRYEIKYALDPSEAYRFQSVLMTHPACFQKAYPDRRVNNIYFDNACFSAAELNLAGISERIKYRYRWYGNEGDFQSGIIEKKIKKNALGTKAYLDIETSDSLTELTDFLHKRIPGVQLKPSLHNTYLRSYYIDRSGLYRLTVDRELRYALPFGNRITSSSNMLLDQRIIIEIKFSYEEAARFDRISADLPFRITKHSKYVTGLLSLLY